MATYIGRLLVFMTLVWSGSVVAVTAEFMSPDKIGATFLARYEAVPYGSGAATINAEVAGDRASVLHLGPGQSEVAIRVDGVTTGSGIEKGFSVLRWGPGQSEVAFGPAQVTTEWGIGTQIGAEASNMMKPVPGRGPGQSEVAFASGEVTMASGYLPPMDWWTGDHREALATGFAGKRRDGVVLRLLNDYVEAVSFNADEGWYRKRPYSSIEGWASIGMAKALEGYTDDMGAVDSYTLLGGNPQFGDTP